MAPREQVKFDIFESKVDEGMLEWFRHRFSIFFEYSLHEPYTGVKKLVVY